MRSAARIEGGEAGAQDQREGGDRAELVQERERQRCGVQHGDDAEHDLEREHGEHRREGAADVAERARAAAQPGGEAEGEKQVADEAVVELHEAGVVEEVAPERRLVEGRRAAGPRRPSAASRCSCGRRRCRRRARRARSGRRRRRPARCPRRSAPRCAGGGPAGARPRGGARRMTYQAIRPSRTKARPRWTARRVEATATMPGSRPERDHPPADRALQAAEGAEREQPRRPAGRQAPASARRTRKPAAQTRPTSAAERAVAPFPPVDRPERVEGHALR